MFLGGIGRIGVHVQGTLFVFYLVYGLLLHMDKSLSS